MESTNTAENENNSVLLKIGQVGIGDHEKEHKKKKESILEKSLKNQRREEIPDHNSFYIFSPENKTRKVCLFKFLLLLRTFSRKLEIPFVLFFLVIFSPVPLFSKDFPIVIYFSPPLFSRKVVFISSYLFYFILFFEPLQ